MFYSILLLRPDYATSNFGQDTFFETVEAPDVKSAQVIAQCTAYEVDNKGCSADDLDAIGLSDDYLVLLVIEGSHQDIKD